MNMVNVLSDSSVLFLYLQITFSLLFSLIITFLSDALSAVPDKSSILSSDASFRKEFHEAVRLKTISFIVSFDL